jgi:hypothetical protein
MLNPCANASTQAASPRQPRPAGVTSAVNVVAAYAATTASSKSSNNSSSPTPIGSRSPHHRRSRTRRRGTPLIGTGYGPIGDAPYPRPGR